MLVELEQVEIMALVVDALLGKREHRLARVGIRFPVVQPQHDCPPRLPLAIPSPLQLPLPRAVDSTERETDATGELCTRPLR